MPDAHPFETLTSLATRSRSAARGLPAQVAIKPHWSGVGFHLLGQRMIAPMGEVAEMLAVPPATRLPGVRPWMLGISNVRGRLMPLVDLEMFFHGHVHGFRRQRRVLVLEAGELYTGLVVNEVHGMQHFPVDAYSSDTPECPEVLRPFVAGGFHLDNGSVWTVFHPGRLAADTAFIDAALSL